MSILKIQSNQARKEHKSIKSSKDKHKVDPLTITQSTKVQKDINFSSTIEQNIYYTVYDFKLFYLNSPQKSKS